VILEKQYDLFRGCHAGLSKKGIPVKLGRVEVNEMEFSHV
jgi:hypothetical protein